MATPKIQRQWLILRTLCARRYGATVKELAQDYETSLKTIRRDLLELQELSFPIREQIGEYGRNYWHCAPNQKFGQLGFDVSEILALYLARQLLEPLAGSLIWEGARSAMRKIRATLREDQCEYLDELSQIIHHTQFRTSNYQGKDLLIDDLVVACEDRTIVWITYQSARSTEPVSYFVHPYGLIHHRHSLYLIAFSQHHRGVRHFKIDRMSDVHRERLKFQKPKEFRLEDYLANSLGIYHEEGSPRQVVVRFDRSVSQYVQEHFFHESQEFTTEASGHLLALFELSSFTELKSWVLSFGPQAEVLEPDDLREEIANDLVEMTRPYFPDEAIS